MPGVADFLVLKHIYENSMQHCWEVGTSYFHPRVDKITKGRPL